MEPYGGDTNVIAKVGTTPEDRGLETEDFKAKFDEGLTAFVEWFNTTHKTEFEAHLADTATKNISSVITTTGVTASSKSAFKIGDLCFIAVVGTAIAAIPAYTAFVNLTGYTTRLTQYSTNANGKSYVIYANGSGITSRVALAQGEEITFSAILLMS